MKRIIILLIIYFVLPANLLSQTLPDFKARREGLMENISPKSIILIKGSSEKLRNGDVYYRFRQSSNLYYFTGIKEPDCTLLLSPGRKIYIPEKDKFVKELIFVQPKNIQKEIWGSIRPGPDEVKEKLGIEEALANTEYKFYLRNLLYEADTLFLENLNFNRLPTSELEIIDSEKENNCSIETASIVNKIFEMREIKSSLEIELIKEAVRITSKAHKNIMKKASPGMYEYELEAIMEYTFKKNSSRRNGFLPIIGSGPNSCILHYNKNNRKIIPGEMVVIDIGAEYNMYCADITRTIPISGEFSERQKEIYNIVLKAHNEAINLIYPGVEKRDIHNRIVDIISEGLINLGLLKEKQKYKKYFMHGSSHPIGLDVHDPSTSKILKSGMIVTIEPGIYIREENLGIRIEDDVLVTPFGCEVLSKSVPVTIEEIENFMNKN